MRLLLVSCAAVLFAACSATPVKCDRDQIPADLLQVPQENQLCSLLQIFDQTSCASEKPASE
jgi:hypothetical protein